MLFETYRASVALQVDAITLAVAARNRGFLAIGDWLKSNDDPQQSTQTVLTVSCRVLTLPVLIGRLWISHTQPYQRTSSRELVEPEWVAPKGTEFVPSYASVSGQ